MYSGNVHNHWIQYPMKTVFRCQLFNSLVYIPMSCLSYKCNCILSNPVTPNLGWDKDHWILISRTGQVFCFSIFHIDLSKISELPQSDVDPVMFSAWKYLETCNFRNIAHCLLTKQNLQTEPARSKKSILFILY